MDVKTTFQNKDLKDEVYITQPKGFINNSQNACKLKNSILWAMTDLSSVVYFLQGYCFIVY
jgi:hypothetical protein